MSIAAVIQSDRAQVALAECKTVMEANRIANVAEAARIYLERTHASVDTVNRATEINKPMNLGVTEATAERTTS